MAAAIWSPAAAQPGFEIQAYPAGLIPAVRFALPTGTGAAVLTAGYNFTDRRDFGEHQDEQGGGPGVGFSWEYGPGDGSSVVLGLRTDVWFLNIDWRDPGRTGRTRVTVVQPTARVGYRWPLGGGWALTPGVAAGIEVNVRTAGQPVGEGPILLLGVALTAGS